MFWTALIGQNTNHPLTEPTQSQPNLETHKKTESKSQLYLFLDTENEIIIIINFYLRDRRPSRNRFRSAKHGGSGGPTRAVLDAVRAGHGVHWAGEEVEEEVGPRCAIDQ